jgi:hypothetical protein
MKYPLFVKGKITNDVFVRGFTHPQGIYAQYWHFDKLHMYINPVTLEYKETKLSFECLRQLTYLLTFKTLKEGRRLYEFIKTVCWPIVVDTFFKYRSRFYHFLRVLLFSILNFIWWLIPPFLKRYRKNIWCGRHQHVFFCISYIKDFRANAVYLVLFGYEFWIGEQRPTFLNKKQNND